MTSRRKNKASPVSQNAKGGSKTAESTKGAKRKRETPSETSPTVSPPKTRTRRGRDASEESPSTSTSTRRASKITPEKTPKQSPKASPATGEVKNSPTSTPRSTRKNQKTSKPSPVNVTPAKQTPGRASRGSTKNTPTPTKENDVKPKQTRTPRSSRKAELNEQEKTPAKKVTAAARSSSSGKKSEATEKTKTPAKEDAPPTRATPARSRKRKPSTSPTNVSTVKEEAKEVTKKSDNSHANKELSPTNRSNRRKRRRGGSKEKEVKEELKELDEVNKDSDKKLPPEPDKPITEEKKILEPVSENTSSKTDTVIVSKTISPNKSPIKTRQLRVQSSETCRSAALCSIPSSAELSNYSNHSSHTNGSSSSKRRLSNGTELEPQDIDWVNKKQKAEVLMGASDEGDVVCGTVPMIHVKTISSSPCKSSSSDIYKDLPTNVPESNKLSPVKSYIRSSPKKYSNGSSTSCNNSVDSSESKDTNYRSSSNSNKSLRTCSYNNKTETVLSSKSIVNDSVKSSEIKQDISYRKSYISNIHTNSSTKKSNTSNEEEKLDSNVAERLLSTFSLSVPQVREITALLPQDLLDGTHHKILVLLVEKLLKGNCDLKHVNAPRLNKLLRQLLSYFCNLDASVEEKHTVCETALSWARERKTVNLRHELELTLMHLYYNTGFYRKAEETANALYKETKKLQDKEKTVKACLCLSKTYHAMGNISKARANITTSKTEALKMYTPPDLQAELDLQSGIMQVAEEKDMETAFSYFKEAATGSTNKKQRSLALKYMLLAKLMINKSEDGEKAVRTPCHINDIDNGVEALLAITKAASLSSLADFKKARETFKTELDGDLVVSGVLDHLYTKMIEKNISNIIMPFERVQISYVAEKIGLVREEVEPRLSQMILDKALSAQLDHRDDCLYVYQPEPKDAAYSRSIETIKQLDKTVTHLNVRGKQLL